MALIKFNRSATKATATGSSRDADTLYFPTDEQSVYLNGKRVGGDAVSSAETAGYATEAGQVTKPITIKKGSTTTTYNGSTDATVTIPTTPSEVGAAPASHNHDKVYSKIGHTHTPSECGAAPSSHNHDSTYSKLGHTHTASEVGAAPSNHTHDIDNITNAGKAAKMGVDTYISNAPSSNLPTSNAVKDYIDRQIKNYTSAFRYAGTLTFGSGAWRVNNIPSDISETDSMDYGTFEGGSPDDTFLQTGFTFYVMSDGTFNEEQVEPGDMVTCVGLYDGEGRWEPSYHIVNGNITVTEQVDESTKVPTAGAVKSAIDTAIEANKYTHPSYDATTGVPTANAAPGFGGTFQVNQIASDSQGHVTSSTARTITIPQTLASDVDRGLMSSEQFRNLNAVLDALTWK